MLNIRSTDVFHGSVECDQHIAEPVGVTRWPVEVLHIVHTGEQVGWVGRGSGEERVMLLLLCVLFQ